MKKAPHGGSNHLGVGKVDRAGAEQNRAESEPVGCPQQRPQVIGIIDLMKQQEAITLHSRQIIHGRHRRNGGHGDNPFRIFVLAEPMPLFFSQSIDIDFP
jgi:hypothetical protein